MQKPRILTGTALVLATLTMFSVLSLVIDRDFNPLSTTARAEEQPRILESEAETRAREYAAGQLQMLQDTGRNVRTADASAISGEDLRLSATEYIGEGSADRAITFASTGETITDADAANGAWLFQFSVSDVTAKTVTRGEMPGSFGMSIIISSNGTLISASTRFDPTETNP